MRLPADLTTVSPTAFVRCPNLAAVTAPFFSASTDTNPDNFEDALVESGFSRINLRDILRGRGDGAVLKDSSDDDDASDDNDDDDDDDDDNDNVGVMYFEAKVWARKRDIYGRLPLCCSAVNSLRWADMRYIFDANMPAVYEVDPVTGLLPCMLAAVGPSSDMESVYRLLKEFPVAIQG